MVFHLKYTPKMTQQTVPLHNSSCYCSLSMQLLDWWIFIFIFLFLLTSPVYIHLFGNKECLSPNLIQQISQSPITLCCDTQDSYISSHLFPASLQWSRHLTWVGGEDKSPFCTLQGQVLLNHSLHSNEKMGNHWMKSSKKPTALTMRVHIPYHMLWLSLCLFIQLVWTQNQNALESPKLYKTIVTWKIISFWLRSGQFLSLWTLAFSSIKWGIGLE